MKIKNISVKPIRIGDVSLLPGETAQVEAVYADAVAFYISMGYFYQEGIFRSGDLNYNKFFVEGETKISEFDDYTSHNTERLDVEGVKKLLLTLSYIREELNA